MTEPVPCPFCGAPGNLHGPITSLNPEARICHCSNERCPVRPTTKWYLPTETETAAERALAAWNTRAQIGAKE